MRALDVSIVSADSARGHAAADTQGVEVAPGLAAPGFVMAFDRNQEVFGEEEDADFVYRVVSGAVRTVRLLSDGRRQIVGFHLAGEMFGWETGAQHRCSAEAIVDCQIVLVKRAALNKMAATNGDVARGLWRLAMNDLELLRDQMLRLGRKTALERVAAFLLEMDDRSDTADALDLPMSRSDIADYLGLTIETVSRTLTQLERGRTIDMPSARHIILRNRQTLSDIDA